jgi:hypothetical protein
VVSFTPRPLYPKGKSPWYPLDRRLGGPQSRSGRCGEEKKSIPCWESNPRTPNLEGKNNIKTDFKVIRRGGYGIDAITSAYGRVVGSW